LIKPKLLTASGGDSDLYIGEKEYLEPGTFTWQVPLGVRRIHACCIGGGGQHRSNSGGGGGGLVWANNIEVEPGDNLRVIVGGLSGDSSIYVKGENRKLLVAEGGDIYGNPGAFSFGDGISGGGGRGGDGSDSAGGYPNGTFTGAGGGAGGYAGSGGDANGGAPAENSGGGSAGTRYYRTSGTVSGTQYGGRGGGVGIRGIGSDGAPPVDQGSGNPARDGLPGSGGDRGDYGGGCAGGKADGGTGAVRIIWGIRFSYPNNADIEAVE